MNRNICDITPKIVDFHYLKKSFLNKVSKQMLTLILKRKHWRWQPSNKADSQCVMSFMQVKQSSKITNGCFSTDSRLAITCSKECHLAIWHTRTARLLAFFVAESVISHCACLSNGVLVAAGANGDIHFMQLPLKKNLDPTPRNSCEKPRKHPTTRSSHHTT